MSDTIARGGLEVVAQADFSDLDRAILGVQGKLGAFKEQAAGVAQGVAGVGRGATEGLKDTDAATQRAARSMEMLAAKARLSAGEFALFKAAARGANTDALLPLAAAIDQFQAKQASAGRGAVDMAQKLGLVGITANQATTAMRQLPAQFTDIFTSLASGQPALTVFLQQGGQIKDTFGGAGNALRALGSVLTPVRLALGGAAAAIVGLGLAYKQGSAEADEYRRALVLTGNAAGATVSQLQNTAEAVSRSVGTQSQAAEVVAQLAASGRVAAGDIGKLAEAAIRLERVGGPAAEETAKAFAELGKEPSKAAAKLNESTNFLTLSVYRQIKALEEQGNAAAAAAVAQDAYANALTTRTNELEAGLGSIERGWRDIKEAAARAWDAMRGIGRAESPEDAMRNELAGMQDRLAVLDYAALGKGTPRALNVKDLLTSKNDLLFERADLIDRINAQRDALREMEVQQRKAAQAAADRKTEFERGKKADEDAAAAAKKAAEEFKRLAEAGAKAAQSMALEGAGLSGNFLQQWKELNAAFKAGAISADALAASQGKLLSQQAFAQDQIKRTVAAYNELVGMQDLRAEGEREIIEAEERARKAREDSVAQFQSALQGMQNEAQAAQMAAAMNISHAEAIARVTLARLEDERVRLVNDPAELAALERKIALQKEIIASIGAKDVREANAKAAADAAREWERTVDSIRDGLTDAFRRAFESGEDFGTAFAKTIGNEIKARIATALAGALADTVLTMAGLNVAAAAGSGGQGGGGNAFGTASNLASMYSAGQRLYSGAQSAYNWGVGAYGTMTGNLATSTAAYTSMANSQALAAYSVEGVGATSGGVAGGSSASGASSIGWAGWVAAAIIAAMQGSADYSAGFRRQQSKETGTALGDAAYRTADLFSRMGVSDRIADMISGATLTARLIGRAAPRVSDTGVMGTLSAGDFSGQAYADIVSKGGLFRSDKRWTETAEVSADLGRFLDDAAKGIFDKAEEYGKALGLPVEALAGITKDIKVTLTDDAEKNMQAITEALGGYGEALVAGYAEAIKPLALYGETTVQTIERVGAAIGGVNEVLNALGLTAITASISGGEAAIALQELFGGIDGLRNAAGSYLQNFYSDAERSNLTMQAIGDTLAEVGLQVPATREQFRGLVDELVNGGGLMTESGRAAFGALMSVQEAFAAVTPAAEDLTQALTQAIEEALPKFQSSGEVLSGTLAGLSAQLAGVGVEIPANVLGRATKQQILDFATSFVQAAENSTQAKIAVVGVAGALADLRADADAAAEGVAEAFSDFRRSLMTDSELFADSLSSIAASLRAAGIEVSESALATATLDQVSAFVDSIMQVGTASTEVQGAVIGAASALVGLAGTVSASQLDARRQASGGNQTSIDAALRTARMNPQWDSKFAQIDAFRAAGSGVAAAWLEGTIANSIGSQPRYASQRGFGVGGGGGGGSYDGPRIGDATKEAADAWRKSIDDLIKSNDRLRGSLTDLRADLIGSELDPANPVAKYESARTEVERLARMASTGDAASVDAFAQQAREFLSLSRDFNASSGAYAADFERVSALLASVDATLAKMNDVAKATLMLNRDGFGELAEQNDAQIELNRMRAGAAEVQRQRHVE